jgi:hypothetical protein
VNRITDGNWRIRGVGDVDRDNRADIIWQNDATGEARSLDRVDDLNWQVVGPG